jgi:hypothetical protein
MWLTTIAVHDKFLNNGCSSFIFWMHTDLFCLDLLACLIITFCCAKQEKLVDFSIKKSGLLVSNYFLWLFACY